MRNLFGDNDDKRETVEDAKLRLRKEELDISKDRIKTGAVSLSKEVVEELKIVDVPLAHEEVIIERRAIDNEPSDTPIGDEETIHIPVSEERIEVGKHTVITGEVMAHKQEVEETEHVEETLRREEARIEKEGDPNIVDTDTLH